MSNITQFQRPKAGLSTLLLLGEVKDFISALDEKGSNEILVKLNTASDDVEAAFAELRRLRDAAHDAEIESKT